MQEGIPRSGDGLAEFERDLIRVRTGEGRERAKIAHVMAIFRAKDGKRRAFAETYGDMRPPMVVKHDGKLMTVFEGSIYRQSQEGPCNFVNILHDHALMFYGVP